MESTVMHLKENHFELIRTGQKKVEFRLNDEKRKALKEGDFIEFQGLGDYHPIAILCEVTSVHRYYKTFSQAVWDNLCCFINVPTDKEARKVFVHQLVSELQRIYPKEAIQKYGICALRLRRKV